MRLFVAVEIGDELRSQLPAAREAMQGLLEGAPIPPRVTWVRDEAAHVTLRFIGETSDEQLTAMQGQLATLEIEPFEVTWGQVGTFGGLRRPRVIWIAPNSGVEQFKDLAMRVSERLDALFGPGEARPFEPHLTLARIRDAGRGVDWRRALAAVRLVPAATRVDHVTVYQSRLSPKGPTYTALSTHG